MTTRRASLALCAVAMVAGFTHAAITAPEPHELRPAVQCFEDGSCTNGYCQPLQQCDDSRDEINAP